MENKIIIKGKINDDNEWNELAIGDTCLSQELYNDYELDKKFIQVSYFISDDPIESEEQVKENALKAFYEGTSTNDYYPICGSSWTGQYDVHQDFTVGEHDLIEELTNYEGKYCLLVINIKNNEQASEKKA